MVFEFFAATDFTNIGLVGMQATLIQLFAIVGPLAAFGVIFRTLGYVVDHRLMSRFGWNSILVTAWLGTPVHELSHVLLCVVFGHKINEVAWFKPDRKAMRLGYVKHSYNPRNPWQVVGQFFIGLAPLAIGSAVLFGMLWLFYADAAQAPLQHFEAATDAQTHGIYMADIPQRTLMALKIVAAPENILTLRFWLFLYLVLCIGGHMSPSASDLEHTHWGALAMLALLLLANLIAAAVGANATWLIAPATIVLIPLYTVLSICLALFTIVAILVVLATMIWDVFITQS